MIHFRINLKIVSVNLGAGYHQALSLAECSCRRPSSPGFISEQWHNSTMQLMWLYPTIFEKKVFFIARSGYKDCLKSTLNRCGIAPSELEALTMDRADWRSSCKSAVEKFEIRHIQELESKRDLHKSGPPLTSNFECQICHRMCRSRIGLLAHNKSHTWWWDPSRRRFSSWSSYCFTTELMML